MNAVQTAAVQPTTLTSTDSGRSLSIGLLRALLLGEAIMALILGVGLSIAATHADAGDNALRFAAGASVIVAIAAAIGSRGARRRRPWAWTLAAILQVIAAVGTGLAVLATEGHPAVLLGFVIAAAVMLVLSTGPVRRQLGQA